MEYLTKDSLKYIKLIQEKNLKHIGITKSIKSINLNKNKYFTEIKTKFLKLYKKNNKFVNTLNVNEYIEKKENKLSDNSYFIGETIRNKILKLKNHYIFKMNEIEFHFITNKSIKFFIHKLKIILSIVYSLKELFHRKKAYQKLTIFDVNYPKQLPSKKEDTIGPNNCNSGYCNVIKDNMKNGSIVLYRNEELIKVLIHESIHANFIDYEIIANQYKSNMDDKICTKYNILLNEAFTETLACILNIILVNYYTKIKINTLFRNEVNYMIYVFNNLMNYYNIKKMSDILINNGCKKYFKQSTNVFSYYVLKTLNYLNINEFLKIMEKHSSNYSINNANYNHIYIHFVFKNIYNLDKYIQTNKIKDKKIRLALYELQI